MAACFFAKKYNKPCSVLDPLRESRTGAIWPQKVEISGETVLFLDVFHKRAGAARGMSDSPEYVQFYETLSFLRKISDTSGEQEGIIKA